MLIRDLIPICSLGFVSAALPLFATQSSLCPVGPSHDKWLLDGEHNLDTLSGMSATEFARLVGDAHRQFGYQVAGATHDGVDLILLRDGELTAVVCSTWRQASVNVATVAALAEAMAFEGATRGILVTIGSFTKEARSYAATHAITLVGGFEVLALIRSLHMRAA